MAQTEFEKIYASKKKLHDLATRFSKAADIDLDADDIVQEAMIVLWELSEKGYPIKNAEALLVKITKNICISRYRKLKAIKKTGYCQKEMLSREYADEKTEKTDIGIIKKTLYSSLTKTEQEYMLMKVDENMTLDEIADATGKTKPGIKTALSKAKAKIKRQLKNIGL